MSAKAPKKGLFMPIANPDGASEVNPFPVTDTKLREFLGFRHTDAQRIYLLVSCVQAISNRILMLNSNQIVIRSLSDCYQIICRLQPPLHLKPPSYAALRTRHFVCGGGVLKLRVRLSFRTFRSLYFTHTERRTTIGTQLGTRTSEWLCRSR